MVFPHLVKLFAVVGVATAAINAAARTLLPAIDPKKFVIRVASERRLRDVGVGWHAAARRLAGYGGLDVAVAVFLAVDQNGSTVEQVGFARVGVGLSGQEADGQDR